MVNAQFSNGYALLIGVGNDLPVTVKDATALYNLLIDSSRAAYPHTNTELLTEKQATRQHILDGFDRLIQRVNNKPDDATAIVYFSGHGLEITHPGKASEYFLVPYGYDPTQRSNTAISSKEFTEKIEAIQAHKLIVLLDCCHAAGVPALKEPGEAVKSLAVPPDLLDILETGSGRVVVASSLDSEKSYTGTPYSIFTACLMEALAGKAAVKKDGYARILDVLIYLFDQVPLRAAPRSQHPFINKILNMGDNFPLCYYAGGKDVPDEPPPVSEPSHIQITRVQRERAQRRYAMLQGEYDLLAEKIKRERRAWIIEQNPAIKFQLEQYLLEDEIAMTRLNKEIKEIEDIL